MHRLRKRFGQHFLTDPQVIQQILVAIEPAPNQHIVEIGPGQGVLTQPLLQAVGYLDAIELDRDLIPQVSACCAPYGQLNLHQADALRFDYRTLQTDTRRLRIVGNLPYNISTPLLFHLLTYPTIVQDMHFMLQKEVVARMAALPGQPAYGRLSVMLQAACRVEALFDISPAAFAPPPRVDSSFVRLVPQASSWSEAHQQAFAQIVARAFAQRRKTLRNNLKPWLTVAHIAAADVDPQARAETLSLAAFHRLTSHYLHMAQPLNASSEAK